MRLELTVEDECVRDLPRCFSPCGCFLRTSRRDVAWSHFRLRIDLVANKGAASKMPARYWGSGLGRTMAGGWNAISELLTMELHIWFQWACNNILLWMFQNKIFYRPPVQWCTSAPSALSSDVCRSPALTFFQAGEIHLLIERVSFLPCIKWQHLSPEHRHIQTPGNL